MPTESDLYQWLGNDSRGVPYQLHLLNLVWSQEGVEHDLQVYRNVAVRLQSERDFWAVILRGAYGWRATLAGCACLLLTHERGYFAELTECFQNGSMVRPQLAVTLGLLHPGEARVFFEALPGIPGFTGPRALKFPRNAYYNDSARLKSPKLNSSAGLSTSRTTPRSQIKSSFDTGTFGFPKYKAVALRTSFE
jgi:hypothetical protein